MGGRTDMAHNPEHPSRIAFAMLEGPPAGEGGETVLTDMRWVTRALRGDARPTSQSNDNEAALFVVLDGHGDTGDLVSNELLSQVANRLVADHWKKEEAELTAQFVKAFEEAHHHMLTFQVDPATGMAPAQQSGAVGVAT